MKQTSTFLIVATAALLLACGKPEEAPAPTEPPSAVEAPQAEPAPVTVPAPATPVTEAAQPVAGQAEMATPPAAPAEVKSAQAAKPDLAHGQQVYRQACAFCHEKGVAGAPKAGDAAAWAPRLAQGMDALYASAMRGKGAMPAKGGNPALADPDVKAAVDYLTAQSR